MKCPRCKAELEEVEVTDTIPARPRQFKTRCLGCGDESLPYTQRERTARRKRAERLADAARPLIADDDGQQWWTR